MPLNMGDRDVEINEIKAIIEGLLFASGDEGITIKQLCRVLDLSEESVIHLLEELRYYYEHTTRGIRMMQSQDTYHLTTKPDHSPYFKKLLETPQSTRLSQAALEALAIIAYNQPITRVEIEEIRGVKSDRPVQTLVARSLIEEVGRRDAVGRPILFGTTTDFLTFFGLTSLDELPPLQEDFNLEDIKQDADLYFERFNQIENNT